MNRRKVFFLAGLACVFVGVLVGAYAWKAASRESSTAEPSIRLFLTLTDTRPSSLRGAGGLPSNTLRSAASTDGYAFTFDPQEWLTSDDMADPTVAVSDDGTWTVASGTGTSSIRAAASSPCPSFSSFPEMFDAGGIPDIVPVDGGFRMYYSGEGNSGILSAFSTDGANYTQEPGTRLALPAGLNLAADPAVARRADGTYVMYFKGTTVVEKTPYNHTLYRATSSDGLTWVAEPDALIAHVSVPGAYADSSGVVWVYYLNFAKWPNERESVWATYELGDGTLAEPKPVTFAPALPSYLWVNDPDPVLVPADIDLSACK